MHFTGAEILIKELINQGVDTVFGYPGGAVLDIYDELYKHSDKISHILVAHEQGASFAADGYARASGKVGVVIATSGPGATNIVTGIANAWLDSVPLVAITGNVAVPLLGKDSFQEVDIVGITQTMVKQSYVVRDIKDLEKTIKEAFLIANTGRKGPVLIDIPKSVQADKWEYMDEPVKLETFRAEFKNDISKAIEAILTSKKPYIYAGGGVLASGASEEVLELSKRISAPIGLSMMGLSAVPASYELNLGMCGMHGSFASTMVQGDADLTIAIGVRFSDRATGDVSEYTKNCKVIHIDIDMAEIDKNVDTKIALCGDVKAILTEVLKELPNLSKPNWIKEVEKRKAEEVSQQEANFPPKKIIETVQKCVLEDTVIATDVGQHQMWTMQFYKFQKTRTLITSGGLGTMGYGLGAAIGSCIAKGKAKTVLFTGDGSFGMNLNELATAVSQKLPVIIIIINNGVLGMVRQWQTMFYNEHYSATTLERKTDFVALAKAFGAEGFEAKNSKELEEILKNKVSENGPTLINCQIDKDENVLPMIPPGGSVNKIITKWGEENGN